MARLAFAWDSRKALANRRKHGVSFEEATTVFDDPLALFAADWEHGEPRLVAIGRSSAGRVLLVVSLELDDERIRVISTRKATQQERQRYEEDE